MSNGGFGVSRYCCAGSASRALGSFSALQPVCFKIKLMSSFRGEDFTIVFYMDALLLANSRLFSSMKFSLPWLDLFYADKGGSASIWGFLDFESFIEAGIIGDCEPSLSALTFSASIDVLLFHVIQCLLSRSWFPPGLSGMPTFLRIRLGGLAGSIFSMLFYVKVKKDLFI